MGEKPAKTSLTVVTAPAPVVGPPGAVPPPPSRDLARPAWGSGTESRASTASATPVELSFCCKPAKLAIGSRGCAPALPKTAR